MDYWNLKNFWQNWFLEKKGKKNKKNNYEFRKFCDKISNSSSMNSFFLKIL